MEKSYKEAMNENDRKDIRKKYNDHIYLSEITLEDVKLLHDAKVKYEITENWISQGEGVKTCSIRVRYADYKANKSSLVYEIFDYKLSKYTEFETEVMKKRDETCSPEQRILDFVETL